MDFKELGSRLGIDEADMMELIELFVTTSLSDIDKIKNGVEQDNAQDAAAASHSIKGAAGNLGLDRISELAKDMEMQAKKGNLQDFNGYIQDLTAQVNALTTS